MHKNYFSSKLGFDVKPWYFNRTKTLDPTGVTFFSDYNIIEACDDGISWPESAIEFVKYLRRNVSGFLFSATIFPVGLLFRRFFSQA